MLQVSWEHFNFDRIANVSNDNIITVLGWFIVFQKLLFFTQQIDFEKMKALEVLVFTPDY